MLFFLLCSGDQPQRITLGRRASALLLMTVIVLGQHFITPERKLSAGPAKDGTRFTRGRLHSAARFGTLCTEHIRVGRF